MAEISPYEKETKQMETNRAWGYGFLWVFLGLLIYSISYFTGRNYPMDTTVPSILVVIGLIKLYQAWRQGLPSSR